MAGKIKFRAKEGGGDFTLVPKGTYQMQIVEVDADVTSKKGDPQIKVMFEVGGDATEYMGTKVPAYFTMDEKFGWKLEKLVEAAGIEYSVEGEEEDEKGKKVRELSFDPDDLLQCWVQVELTHYKSEKDGKTYHNLDKFDVSPLSATDAPPAGDAPPADAPPAGAPATAERRRRPGA